MSRENKNGILSFSSIPFVNILIVIVVMLFGIVYYIGICFIEIFANVLYFIKFPVILIYKYLLESLQKKKVRRCMGECYEG
ncbi:MAG: hypothetical protein QXH92_03855 [Candidatus Aenigmatarchaeota archaeon]